jgi:hypothetical protein
LRSWELGCSATVAVTVAPLAPAVKGFGVASGVDALLSTCAQVFDRGAQAGVQAAACGDATQSQKGNNTKQMSIIAENAVMYPESASKTAET